MRELRVLHALVQPQELANDRGKVAVLAYQDSCVVLIIEGEREHVTCYLDIDSLLLLVLDDVVR